MTSSGVTTYNPTALSIIKRAFRLLRVTRQGETPGPNLTAEAFEALNELIKHWQATGIHVWTTLEAILFLQPLQASYEIGPGTADHCCAEDDHVLMEATSGAVSGATSIVVDTTVGVADNDKFGVTLADGTIQWTQVNGTPTATTITFDNALTGTVDAGAFCFAYTTDLVRPLKIPDARRHQFSGLIDTTMTVLSHLDYQQQPQKLNPGVPTQWFYQPTLNRGTMKVWPAPVNVQSAIRFTYYRPLEIFVTNGNTANLPEEWSMCLAYNLAMVLAPEYDLKPARIATLGTMSQTMLNDMKMFDREPEPVLFQVDMSPGQM